MNSKYLLPASIAVSVHAFVLFGLNGKTPARVVAPDAGPVFADPLPPSVELDPPAPEPADGGETDGPPGKDGGASSLTDVPVLHPPGDPFFTRPSPKIAGDPKLTTIPTNWNRPGGGGGNAPEVIDWRSLDRVPRGRVLPAPDYPYEAKAKGLDGTVVVEFLVDEAGNAYAPSVRSATSPIFVDAALRAVARWKFEPGTSHGRPVRFRMLVPVVFKIDAD